ncbi:cell division protein FtsZ [compost metagenome]
MDGDANIIFGAAFDPALDGKIRVSVVATGMDEAVIQKIEPQGSAFSDRRPAAAAPRQPEVRIDPVREPVRAPEPAPVYEAPAARVAPEPRPEPVIHDAPRNLEPIVDPWVEEYESGAVRAQPAAAQGDLYFDRGQPEQQPQARPAPRREEAPVAEEEYYDDRDHRRSGWSLFGKKRQQPQQQQPSYAPQPSSNRTTQQLRQTQATQPTQDYQAGHAEDDDLEIPSFLRRLAN